MSSTTRKRAARRSIDRHGQDVTLRNYESGTETEYGETWVETTDSPKTVKAIFDRTSRSYELDRDSRSADLLSARAYHVKDTVTGIRDGGGNSASEIDDPDGTTWVVMQKDDLGGGQFRLFCRRVD